jgi:hypothetical protein
MFYVSFCLILGGIYFIAGGVVNKQLPPNEAMRNIRIGCGLIAVGFLILL